MLITFCKVFRKTNSVIAYENFALIFMRECGTALLYMYVKTTRFKSNMKQHEEEKLYMPQ